MSKVTKFRIPLNLQMFAEGGPPPVVPPVVPPVTPPVVPPQGQTFSEDYVKSLRDEAKAHRLTAKQHETTLRGLIGVKDGDITPEHITAYQASQTKAGTDALAKANDRLITAEVKSLEGYNHKLLEKLLDRTKVTIADDGTITGLKEAAEALALEFPEVKKVATPGAGGANPPGAGAGLTEIQQLEAALAAATTANNHPLMIALKNKLFELQKPK